MIAPLALLTLAAAGLILAGWLPPEAAAVVAGLWLLATLLRRR